VVIEMRKQYDFNKAVQGAHFKRYRQGHQLRVLDGDAPKENERLENDTQLTELAGRFALISQLTEDGLEVALPIRDRGVDLIAYADLDEQGGPFAACPIQLKVTTGRRFELDRKYERIANLLLVYIWDVKDVSKSRTYALTYAEALDVMKKKGFTETPSWKKGRYSVASPGKDLVHLLEPYRMQTKGWHSRILSAAKQKELKTA
jgi:hypothetical protein